MNNIKKYSVTLSILVIGFLVGASALSVMAQGNNWAPPPQSPPFENVDAPINVGGDTQVKTGLLSLANLLFNPTGGSINPGDVLSADISGTGRVEWKPKGSVIDFSVVGASRTLDLGPPFTTVSFSPAIGNNVKGIIASVIMGNAGTNCTDEIINLYTMDDKLVGYIGGWVESGPAYSTQTSGFVIIPVTNGQFKARTLRSTACYNVTFVRIADIY